MTFLFASPVVAQNVTDDSSAVVAETEENVTKSVPAFPTKPDSQLSPLDRNEPDGSFAEATPITDGTYSGYEISGGDDYFVITLAEGEELTASIDFDHSVADVDMALYDPDRSVIDSSASVTDGESVSTTADQAGTYYVRVYRYAGNEADYSISIETSENDGLTFDNAIPVETGTTTTTQVDGVDDYYAINLDEGEELDASIDFEDDDADIDMELYDPTQTEIDGSYSTSDDESVSTTDAQSGTYYIRVYRYSGGDETYELSVSTSSSSDTSPLTAQNGVAINGDTAYTIANGEINAIDLTTMDVVNSFQAPDGTDQGLAYGAGSLWYADAATDSYNGQIVELDPETGEQLSTINTGYDPYGLAFGDGSLYAAEVTSVPDAIHEFSPDGTELNEFGIDGPLGPVGAAPHGLAYYDGSIWVGGGPGLYQLDSNGAVEQRFEDRDEPYRGLAGTETTLYGPGEDGSLTVLRESTSDVDPEPENNDPSGAVTVDDGTYEGGLGPQNDYYAIDAEAGELISIEVLFDHDNGDLDAELISPSGNIIDESTSTTDDESVGTVASEGGTYLVNFYRVGSGEGNDYTFTVDTPFRPDNDHRYEVITVDGGITWDEARDRASQRTVEGMQGYLATITSEQENEYITALTTHRAWIGASDAQSEGTWRWVTGPEGQESDGNGRHFFTQTGSNLGDEYSGNTSTGGFPVEGSYANWNPSTPEPNNAGGDEDYAHLYPDGEWNDNQGYRDDVVTGFVVEYGDLESQESESPLTAQNGVAINGDTAYTIANGEINAIDLTTMDVVNSFQAPDGTDQGLAYGAGSLWYADAATDSYNGQIVELDPETGEQLSTINTGYDPYGLAFGDGSLYAAEVTSIPDSIHEFSPDGTELNEFGIDGPLGPVGAAPHGLAYYDGSIWVGGGPGLYQLDSNGAVEQRFEDRDEPYRGLAGTETTLYGPGEDGSLTVLRESTSDVDPEPENNDPSGAVTLPDGTYEGGIGPAEDYYRIEINSSERIEVDVEFDHSEGDVDAELLDSNTNVIDSSTSTTDDESVSADPSSGGTYYLRIYRFDSQSDGTEYDITVETPVVSTPPSGISEIADRQVALNGEVTVSVAPGSVDHNLGIEGETEGWTVMSTTPSSDGVTVSPEAGTVLGPDEAITTFGSYEDGDFSVTLAPPSDASEGETYEFTAQELVDDTIVDSESFTITTGSSAPSWVAESSITAAQFNAFDDGDGELTDAEIRVGIQTYVQNSITGEGEVNGVAFNDDEIRALISGYIQSQLG